MTTTEAFAPAKINLTLHVTGQRGDGYHLLDSLVMFADVGDTVRLSDAPEMSLSVTGPMACGVPQDARNLCWKAAEAFGCAVAMQLDKHLPAAAGIGGGSSDAAAVLRAMEALYRRPAPVDPVTLGADVLVCTVAQAARMSGIGDHVLPLSMDRVAAVLVNPRVAVSTADVFRALPRKDNPPMEDWGTEGGGFDALIDWLARQRNDLQAPAIALQPVIADVLTALAPATLARMSGSGATCYGLCASPEQAQALAARIAADHPGWWVRACTLS